MKKRGVSNIDFPLSLAIFLIIIAWFFIIIRPAFAPQVSPESLVGMLRHNFEGNMLDTIERVPILIRTNITKDNYPIIVDFNDSGNISFPTSYVLQDRFYFLANLSHTKIFYITKSKEENNPDMDFGFSAERNSTSSQDYETRFFNGELSGIKYLGSEQVYGTELTMDNYPLGSRSLYNATRIFARYDKSTELINATYFVFAKNPAVYLFLYSNTADRGLAKLRIALANPRQISVDDLYIPEIENCISFSTEHIDISGENSLFISSSKTANYTICDFTGQYTLEIEANLTQEPVVIKLVSHRPADNSTSQIIQGYDAVIGVPEKENGLYYSGFNELENISYTQQKLLFNLPHQRDFSILAKVSDETVLEIGKELPKDVNIYTDSGLYAMYSPKGVSGVKVRYAVW